MSCVFAKQKRQRVAKFATLLQCTKKSLMGTRFCARPFFLVFCVRCPVFLAKSLFPYSAFAESSFGSSAKIFRPFVVRAALRPNFKKNRLPQAGKAGIARKGKPALSACLFRPIFRLPFSSPFFRPIFPAPKIFQNFGNYG